MKIEFFLIYHYKGDNKNKHKKVINTTGNKHTQNQIATHDKITHESKEKIKADTRFIVTRTTLSTSADTTACEQK